jgi:serine/threonine-protein kinase
LEPVTKLEELTALEYLAQSIPDNHPFMVESTTSPERDPLDQRFLSPDSILYRIEGKSWHIASSPKKLTLDTHSGDGVDSAFGDRYRVLQAIGSGGFSKTYLAVMDTGHSQQEKCLIKQLCQPLESLSQESIGVEQMSISTEAELLQQLGKHPNIPALLDSFEIDGEFYLVQEYIEGHSLREELIAGKCLSEFQAIDLLEKVLEVLFFIHNRCVIHRDLKPSNIIRARDGQLFLIDFGAVKRVTGDWGSTSVAIGTRSYAAPEQMEGHPRLNSDIYALGIVALEALSGIPAQHLHEDSPTGPVKLKDLPMSPGLARILGRMVCQDCRERYQVATEVLDDLRQIAPPNYWV